MAHLEITIVMGLMTAKTTIIGNSITSEDIEMLKELQKVPLRPTIMSLGKSEGMWSMVTNLRELVVARERLQRKIKGRVR